MNGRKRYLLTLNYSLQETIQVKQRRTSKRPVRRDGKPL